MSKVIIAPFLLREMQIMETPTSNKVQIQKSFITRSVEVSMHFYSVNGTGSRWQRGRRSQVTGGKDVELEIRGHGKTMVHCQFLAAI